MPLPAWFVMTGGLATITPFSLVKDVRDSSNEVSRRTWYTPVKMKEVVSSINSPETIASTVALWNAHKWAWREKVCWKCCHLHLLLFNYSLYSGQFALFALWYTCFYVILHHIYIWDLRNLKFIHSICLLFVLTKFMNWRSLHLQRFVRTDPQEENTETKSPVWMKSVPWSTVTGRCYLFRGPKSRSQQNHLRIPSWRGLSMPDQTLYQEWMVNRLIHE